MFEWKVEDMVLLNQKGGLFLRGGKEKIYDCESNVSREDDTKYSRPIIDDHYRYGKYFVVGMERYITNNGQGSYDTYEDLVDELFHRQLKICEQEEQRNYH